MVCSYDVAYTAWMILNRNTEATELLDGEAVLLGTAKLALPEPVQQAEEVPA